LGVQNRTSRLQTAHSAGVIEVIRKNDQNGAGNYQGRIRELSAGNREFVEGFIARIQTAFVAQSNSMECRYIVS
jgi:hypothetical protein